MHLKIICVSLEVNKMKWYEILGWVLVIIGALLLILRVLNII